MSDLWQIRFDEDQNLLINQIIGSPSIEQLVAIMKEARQHPKWSQYLPVLWDFSEATLSQIDLNEIYRIKELSSSIQDPVRPTSVAFVTSSPLDHGIIRQIISAAGWGDQSFKVFGHREEAIAWIDSNRGDD